MKSKTLSAKHNYIFAVTGIILLWAMIYLPSISVPDISRNECRRVLPAITMLETGNWSTPMLAGKPYYRKPPLMNWLVATSYELTGERNTLTARLPTTLIILGLAIMLLFMPSGILDFKARFISSCVFLTSIGLITNGKSADIDPNYVCMAGAAVLLWLNAWSKDISGWGKWLPVSIPLALGILLKGPLILLVFYVFVITMLILNKNKKELYSIWHIIAILLSLLPFCVWSYYSKQGHLPQTGIQDASMSNVWYHEIMYRFNFDEFRFRKWFGRVLLSIVQFLPWLLGFLLLWNKAILSKLNEKQLLFARSSRIAVIILFVLINAMPETKARYTLPLLPLIAIITGLLLIHVSITPKWIKIIKRVFLPLFSIIFGASLILFLTFILCKTVIPVDVSDNIKLKELLSTSSSVPFWLMMLSIFLTFKAFIYYRQNNQNLRTPFALLLTLTTAVAITLNTYFVYIFPLTSTFSHYAIETADAVNNFSPENSVVCGVGYVGEEPFVAHIQRKWKMIEKLSYLKDPLNIFIIDENILNTLDEYKKRFFLHEISRKNIAYKSHKYLLIRLEKL